MIKLICRCLIFLVCATFCCFAIVSNDGDGQAERVDNRSRRLSSPEHHTFVDPTIIKNDELDDYKVIMVYFAYVYPQRPHWLDLIREQLDDFNCNGLAARLNTMYVSIAIDFVKETDKNAAELVNSTIATVKEIIPHAIFDITLENRFEYPGIRKVWDIAQSIESETEAHKTIIIYMHSKGMVNTYLPNFHSSRVPLEIKLFHATFDRWDEVLYMYRKHKELTKVGCLPGYEGNVWFNIFYVRASYAQTLVNPTIAKDRYYYEHWLKFIDNERYWPRGNSGVTHIEFAERDVYRASTTNSGCGGCWSTCMPRIRDISSGGGSAASGASGTSGAVASAVITGSAPNETIGSFFQPAEFPFDYINDMDWARCRAPTRMPRPPTGEFSKNDQYA